MSMWRTSSRISKNKCCAISELSRLPDTKTSFDLSNRIMIDSIKIIDKIIILEISVEKNSIPIPLKLK